jgi:hypothetical protein
MPRSTPSLFVATVFVAVLTLAACTGDPSPDGEDPVTDLPDDETRPDEGSTDAGATDDGDTDAAACRHDDLEDEALVTLAGDDPVGVGSEVAVRTHRCAPIAVVAPAGGWDALLAVPVARAMDAPLLLVDPAAPTALTSTLDALEVDELVAVGLPLDDLDRPGTALVVPETTGTGTGTTDEQDATAADDTTEEDTPADGTTEQDTPADGSTEEDATADDTTEEDTPADDTTEEDTPADDDAAGAARLAVQVAEHLEVERFLAVRSGDAHALLAAAYRTDGTTGLLPVPDEEAALAELAASLPAAAHLTAIASDDAEALADQLRAAGLDAEAATDGLWPSDPGPTGWLADPAQPDVAAVAAVAAAGRGEALLPVDAADLRAGDDARRLREVAPDRVVLVGDVTEDADWQLETVLTGPTLPGGGHRLFENERMVAIYGHPGSTVLGALGEQDLDGAVERVREVAAPYGADGAEVLPTFEIITTIASAEAGPRGDYSRRTDPDVLRPWIDRAAEEGFYVVLDLQPGRTDFLEQAQEYEDLLREPHVGLALDPEWRLEPDQVHLRQIGSVQAEEVQRVADWLAALTREHRLPQKALVLHQFRLAMLPDRDTIETPPELAIVVHMDGQGAIEDKYATYDLITTGAEDRWVWGWKNFYDEDFPTPTPDEVLAVEPLPWFVTYQ